jgi:molecular chaperone GrpE
MNEQHGLEPRRQSFALVVQDRPPRGARRSGYGRKDRPNEAQAPVDSRARRSGERQRDEDIAALLAERTADLQRLQAEYENYRKRVRRDQLAVREIAVVNVLRALLPVLDTIEQAAEHGDVTSALGLVADVLNAQLGELGLEPVGAPSEPFDPTRHDAVAHQTSNAVTEPTCVAVLRRGYRVGQSLLRPAHVVVAEPPAHDEESPSEL